MIKFVHVLCAFLSISGFVARGILMMRASPMLTARWVKVAPHFIDTVLLGSAIMLASQWGWSALQLPWIVAKISALFVYIALGTVALRGRNRSVRMISWFMAIIIFTYIVAVAVSKNPLILL